MTLEATQAEPAPAKKPRHVLPPRWKPGQSGNPGGKSKIELECKMLAQKHCPEAIGKLITLMRSADERVAIVAIRELLERGLGKVKDQAVVEEGKQYVIRAPAESKSSSEWAARNGPIIESGRANLLMAPAANTEPAE